MDLENIYVIIRLSVRVLQDIIQYFRSGNMNPFIIYYISWVLSFLKDQVASERSTEYTKELIVLLSRILYFTNDKSKYVLLSEEIHFIELFYGIKAREYKRDIEIANYIGDNQYYISKFELLNFLIEKVKPLDQKYVIRFFLNKNILLVEVANGVDKIVKKLTVKKLHHTFFKKNTYNGIIFFRSIDSGLSVISQINKGMRYNEKRSPIVKSNLRL